MTDARLTQAVRTTEGFIAAVVALGLAATFLIEAPGSVIASGFVDPAGRPKVITHQTGGILKRLLVEDGQRVAAGQTLMTFDADLAGVGKTSAADDLNSLLARRSRLEAERNGESSLAGTHPNDLAFQREARQMRLDRQSRDGQRAQLAERVSQAEREIEGLEAQAAAARRQRVIIQPEIDGTKALWEKRLVPLSRLNQIERDAVGLESTDAALKARMAASRAQIAELRQNILQIDADARTRAGTELAEIESHLGDARTKAAATADQQRRTAIVAPSAGLVDTIAYRTVGSAVPANQPVMRIVPDRDAVEVDARLPIGDVDQVHAGQPVRLRFTALNAQRTPQVDGRVRTVAADRTTDDKGGTWYAMRIAVDRAEVAKLGIPIRAGMPVEAYIRTSERSLLSYITKPLRDQMGRTFREGD